MVLVAILIEIFSFVIFLPFVQIFLFFLLAARPRFGASSIPPLYILYSVGETGGLWKGQGG